MSCPYIRWKAEGQVSRIRGGVIGTLADIILRVRVRNCPNAIRPLDGSPWAKARDKGKVCLDLDFGFRPSAAYETLAFHAAP